MIDFDCTQRQLVDDIARIIYKKMGYLPPSDIFYFFNSEHPQERMVLAIAEEVFELFYGDSPDYSDEGDD